MRQLEGKKIMLRTAGLFLMLLVPMLYVQAQDETSTEVTVQTKTEAETKSRTVSDEARVGIKGGLNVSNFITDDVHDKNAKAGFHVGIYGQLFSTNAFAIQPEINYSTKGNKTTIMDGIIDQENKFNLNYIDVPILAVFKLGEVVEIHAGPYWAYLVGANIDTDGDLQDDFAELDRDNFEDWDYGLVGGIGLNFNTVQLGARYNYGLNEIARSQGAKRWLGSETKNSLGQLYLAFNFAR